ncbi:hypothetical protein LI142_15790 [Eubacterium limosum]|uniref:Uncharacterized protein n=1 Tax=Eubacterium limosum TaxID=1736 RepID=A0ABT5UTJ0_EUBLI|nr:hypothetical protein [Eubacterium limosum]MCB6570963.1 hypothetical protein [Eubacterium limosum]MDE1472287.1 hypothetical protein [Eubacterium limosum]
MSIGQKIRTESKKQNLNDKQLALKVRMPYTSFYSTLKRDSQRVSAVSLYKTATPNTLNKDVEGDYFH